MREEGSGRRLGYACGPGRRGPVSRLPAPWVILAGWGYLIRDLGPGHDQMGEGGT